MKPILFNTEMVRAIPEGRKTVTRRVVKPQPKGRLVPELPCSCWPGYFGEEGTPRVVRPPYFIGDILYVRETWNGLPANERAGIPAEYWYKADEPEDADTGVLRNRWHPSIHMPKEAARLFLRVKSVRVERLQDITDEQARKEGCADRQDFLRVWNDCYAKPRPVKGEDGTIDHYESYPWEDIQETRNYRGKPWYVIGNSWLWVIEFERISKEEALEQKKGDGKHD